MFLIEGEGAVVAQWIRPRTLSLRSPVRICWQWQVVPLAKVVYNCVVPQKGFEATKSMNPMMAQGRIQDFHLGGAQKIMCQHAHYERRTELTFGRGPGPARALEALGLF